jgi:hypothetical protein
VYIVIALLLTVVLPLTLAGIDASMPGSAFLIRLGKWELFWAAGVRLLLAGARQALQPGFTAERIFGLAGNAAWVIVRELGFANLALGLLGTASAFYPPWRIPAALCGGLFYGLAGLNHLLHTRATRLQDVAMATDFVVFGVLAAFLATQPWPWAR